MLAQIELIVIGIGMAIGFTRIITGWLPLIAAVTVVILSFLFLAGAGVWAASCPHCLIGWEDTRKEIFGGYVVIAGIIVVPLVVGIAAGALAASPIVHWRRNRSQPT